MLVYQRVNLHFPMVFLWFSHFPMIFLWFSYVFFTRPGAAKPAAEFTRRCRTSSPPPRPLQPLRSLDRRRRTLRSCRARRRWAMEEPPCLFFWMYTIWVNYNELTTSSLEIQRIEITNQPIVFFGNPRSLVNYGGIWWDNHGYNYYIVTFFWREFL